MPQLTEPLCVVHFERDLEGEASSHNSKGSQCHKDGHQVVLGVEFEHMV
jgi:hypothetical protein